MNQKEKKEIPAVSRQAEEHHLNETLSIVCANIDNYQKEVTRMSAEIQEMLDHYHDNDAEVYTILSNTITLNDHMKRALQKNVKAKQKPYFGRIVFHDETLDKEESIYIGKGGISKDMTHWVVIDWRAPVANVYYENGLGKCSYTAPEKAEISIDLKLKRTYEIEDGKLIDFFDTEVVANDDILTKYLAKNKQAVLGEIIATIQKEQNEIIRKSPYHNIIVQGVAGSGKTTVAMHRISYILYNYKERFKPEDFYVIGSNRILLNYITGVLPDLDVYGIKQMTMEQLFVRLLYEDWDEKKYRIGSFNQADAGNIVKGTLAWFYDLESYCRRLEQTLISTNPIIFYPTQKELLSSDTIKNYVQQNPKISIQSKINMLNTRVLTKVKDELTGKEISYTDEERKEILKEYRQRYGKGVWTQSIFDLYHDFFTKQSAKGCHIAIPETELDVYDLAALAYLYKRVKETEVISEAHHIVIDEAQDFGMMAYAVLKFCVKDCTYTIMGDISQNIHFGYGLNDWEELKTLLLTNNMDSFNVLKKSYRNTIEISEFATKILRHGHFSIYPVEPIIRHGSPVTLLEMKDQNTLLGKAASVCKAWQKQGFDTIAVVCRNQESASKAAKELRHYMEIIESDLEKAVFGSGVMVLPVEYTKGLEFDAVLILDPTRNEYPVDDGHAKLLYVAATRALHELCILHNGNLTGLIADPLPKETVTEISSKAGNDAPPASMPQKGTASAAAGNLSSEKQGAPIAGKKVTAVSKTEISPANINTKTNVGINTTKPRIDKPYPTSPKPDSKAPLFGDMPATEKLRPAGHARIDLSVKWVTKHPDGLYIQSRYGILRLTPIGSAIVRITFTKGTQIIPGYHPGIAVRYVDKTWMYRESGSDVSLMTDELCLQIDKASGAVHYMTRDKKTLLMERKKECRQIETDLNGINKTWLFLDWQKNENIYGIKIPDTSSTGNIALRKKAIYISHGSKSGELPFLLSDKGYGILMATDAPTLCCDIPSYGSYLHTDGDSQIDYYFIAGKQPNTILNAYAYLCGKL